MSRTVHLRPSSDAVLDSQVDPNAATPPTSFSQQPTLTEKNATINDTTGVKVTVLDAFGNPRPGDSVTVSIARTRVPGRLAARSRETRTHRASRRSTTSRSTTRGSGTRSRRRRGHASRRAPLRHRQRREPVLRDVHGHRQHARRRLRLSMSPASAGALSSRLGPATAAAPGSARLGVTVAYSVPSRPTSAADPPARRRVRDLGRGVRGQQALVQGRRHAGQEQSRSRATVRLKASTSASERRTSNVPVPT